MIDNGIGIATSLLANSPSSTSIQTFPTVPYAHHVTAIRFMCRKRGPLHVPRHYVHTRIYTERHKCNRCVRVKDNEI